MSHSSGKTGLIYIILFILIIEMTIFNINSASLFFLWLTTMKSYQLTNYLGLLKFDF